MDAFIPKEKLTAYERWELAAFDEGQSAAAAANKPPPADTAAPPAVPETALPTAEEIERIHAAARAAGEREGYAAGRAAGLEAGRAEGLAAAQREADQLHAIADDFRRALDPAENAYADALLQLALAVASQVIRGSLKVRPEMLLPVVRDAMATLPNQHGHPALILHPDDAELIRPLIGEQLAHSGWRLIEDASVQPGGCRVENAGSEVDATLPTRWRRVVDMIGVTASQWLDGAEPT